jgi:choline dehydrogenase-like flavoprotein
MTTDPRFMIPRTKTSIAIIGSGLSSALLAKRLAEVADVTVFERGGASPQKPRHIETGRPLGLSPSYGHGFGGTTNYWVGAMLRLRPGEMSSNWPAGMHEALADREKEAIAFTARKLRRTSREMFPQPWMGTSSSTTF